MPVTVVLLVHILLHCESAYGSERCALTRELVIWKGQDWNSSSDIPAWKNVPACCEGNCLPLNVEE